MENTLLKIPMLRIKDEKIGIYSACSASPLVIKAVIKKGKKDNSCVLIESTANQCDQFGGYTGMTPSDFKKMVEQFADEYKFDKKRLFLGGDHLGPLTFAKKSEEEAMKLAEDLIETYVLAGFTKIHIDTSMRLSSDSASERLSDAVIIRRAIRLAKKAEEAFEKLISNNPDAVHPVYVIGSEVPIPGGALSVPAALEATKVMDFRQSVTDFENAFIEAGLDGAWKQVIAFVVQPGIEENDNGCVDYDREKAAELSSAIEDYPNLVFEAHSTDYQTRKNLRYLVEDGFAILKVGPALTFALREGLFALSFVEDEICDNPSNFRTVLEEEMIKNPKYWESHYHGSEKEKAVKRKFSFSDRSRYYMAVPAVKESIEKMMDNLKDRIPLSVLKQYMPHQYEKIRNGELNLDPEELLIDKISEVIEDYMFATNQKNIL